MKRRFGLRVCLPVLLLLFVGVAHSGSQVIRWWSLQGVRGVFVQAIIGNLNADEQWPREEEIRKQVQARLKQAGIPILTQEQRQRTPGRPVLTLHLEAAARNREHGNDFRFQMTVTEDARLERGPQHFVCSAAVWETPGYYVRVKPGQENLLRDNIAQMTDMFISEYQNANPKK